MTEAAPFHHDLAEGPDGGEARWLLAEDGVRIRSVLWAGGSRGTVFVFPGRCEYAEKYGRSVQEIVARGYTALAVDWRGQGMSDRLLRDPGIGHVRRFTDYQYDVAALFAQAREAGLPEPFFLLAHSMGGCIGLRSLVDGKAFAAAVFSAPMWGVRIAPKLEAAAHILPIVATRLGLGGKRTPTTGRPSYLIEAPFEGNLLTTDEEMWSYMVGQARAEERFRLGGPSLMWLGEALAETRALLRAPRPDVPAHASVGTLEKIVVAETVEAAMADWPKGSFDWVEGAEHELLMEREPIRRAFLDRMFRTFDAASDG